MSLRVEEFHDWRSLAALRPAWNELSAVTPGATYFQSFDWLETYWKHFGSQQRLRILAVRRSGEIVGIVPLAVLRERSSLGTIRRLTYPLDYWGSFYGPIGPQSAETLQAALAHLRRTPHDWDLLDLRFAPPEGDDPARTAAAMTAAGFAPQATPSGATSLVDLTADYADYLAQRTPKFRNNLRRWQRRLHDQGEVRYVRYRPAGVQQGDAEPRWDWYDACEAVARKSWQGSSTTGTTITHSRVRTYLREAHVAACRFGAADVNLLYLNDRPIAFLYGYAYRGSLYGLRIGFDAESSRHGVGNLLYLQVIEDSIARGDRTFDLGPGSLEAKRMLVSRVVPIRRLTYANPFSLHGLLWRAKRFYLGDGTGDAAAEADDTAASVEPLQQQA